MLKRLYWFIAYYGLIISPWFPPLMRDKTETHPVPIKLACVGWLNFVSGFLFFPPSIKSCGCFQMSVCRQTKVCWRHPLSHFSLCQDNQSFLKRWIKICANRGGMCSLNQPYISYLSVFSLSIFLSMLCFCQSFISHQSSSSLLTGSVLCHS